MKRVRSSRYEKDPEARFWMNVKSSKDGCWEYCSHLPHNKHRAVVVKGRKIAAHRYSYELHAGPIPEGLCVCHKCDNPACIRPDHLFLGTQTDNMRDCVDKKRHSYGIASGKARLDESSIAGIVPLRKQGLSEYEVAARLGVSRSAIASVCQGRSWKHLDSETVTRWDADARAKLTPGEVIEIRKLLEQGVPQVEIAKQFNVSRGNISAIYLGRSWKSI